MKPTTAFKPNAGMPDAAQAIGRAKSASPAARRARGLQVVTFWWPVSVVQALDAEAKRRGMSRAALVQALLESAPA